MKNIKGRKADLFWDNFLLPSFRPDNIPAGDASLKMSWVMWCKEFYWTFGPDRSEVPLLREMFE